MSPLSGRLLLLCLMLSACGAEEYSDIKQWMAEESKNIKGGVKDPPPLVSPPIVSYSAKQLLSPFSPEKAKTKEGGVNDPAGPSAGRTPEYLEGFPLESMKLIGVIGYKGQMFALIQTPEKPKHVTIGNFMGPNFGKITEITKTQMRVVETVKDSNDLWVKREKVLYLQQDEGATK